MAHIEWLTKGRRAGLEPSPDDVDIRHRVDGRHVGHNSLQCFSPSSQTDPTDVSTFLEEKVLEDETEEGSLDPVLSEGGNRDKVVQCSDDGEPYGGDGVPEEGEEDWGELSHRSPGQ